MSPQPSWEGTWQQAGSHGSEAVAESNKGTSHRERERYRDRETDREKERQTKRQRELGME